MALYAQGGWRQWDVYLRDGTRREANPLGARDDAHVAISVGGVTGHDTTFARARIAYIAAQAPAESLPPAPLGDTCTDVVVRRDGRRTTGHVTLTHVEYSEGTVTQRGDSIDLRDVAYLVFARSCRGAHRHRHLACRGCSRQNVTSKLPFRTCSVPFACPEPAGASNENVPAIRFAVSVVTVIVPDPPLNAVPQPPVVFTMIAFDPLPPAARLRLTVPGAVRPAMPSEMVYDPLRPTTA